MINEKILDGVKLVSDESYFATDAEVEGALEHAFQQGSQGWGVRREQGVMLRMARDTKLAYGLAKDAVENQNKLKGLQLENGRLKKRIAILEGMEAAHLRTIEDLKRQLDRATRDVGDLSGG